MQVLCENDPLSKNLLGFYFFEPFICIKYLVQYMPDLVSTYFVE